MRAAVLLLILLPSGPAAAAEAGAKSVFYDTVLHRLEVAPAGGAVDTRLTERDASPGHPPEVRRNAGSWTERADTSGANRELTAAAPPIAVRYCLRRVDATGSILGDAPLGVEFRSGDQVQLTVESNLDGQLAIVQHGSNGHIGLLYPPPAERRIATPIEARRPLVLPSPRHSFTFDATPGTERLWLVFGREASAVAGLPLAGAMDASDLEVLRLLVDREIGAKNLVVESLNDPGDPCTYAADLEGRLVVQEIELLHR